MSEGSTPESPDGGWSTGLDPHPSEPEIVLARLEKGRWALSDGKRAIKADAEAFVEVRR